MGLYDAVDRGGADRKKEKTLRRPLLIAAAVFAAVIALGVWACRYQLQYRACFSALTDATRHARSTGAFTVTVDGAAVSADADDLSDLLRLINMAGAGRTGPHHHRLWRRHHAGHLAGAAGKPRQRLDGRPLLPLHVPLRQDLRLRHRPDPHDPPHPPVLIGSVKAAPSDGRGCSLSGNALGKSYFSVSLAARFLPYTQQATT